MKKTEKRKWLNEFCGMFIRKLNAFLDTVNTVNRHKATSILEYEIGELENIFALLVCGSFIGMPSPPAHITLQLLPFMEKEMINMFEKVLTAHDPIGELAEVLGEI